MIKRTIATVLIALTTVLGSSAVAVAKDTTWGY